MDVYKLCVHPLIIERRMNGAKQQVPFFLLSLAHRDPFLDLFTITLRPPPLHPRVYKTQTTLVDHHGTAQFVPVPSGQPWVFRRKKKKGQKKGTPCRKRNGPAQLKTGVFTAPAIHHYFLPCVGSSGGVSTGKRRKASDSVACGTVKLLRVSVSHQPARQWELLGTVSVNLNLPAKFETCTLNWFDTHLCCLVIYEYVTEVIEETDTSWWHFGRSLTVPVVPHGPFTAACHLVFFAHRSWVWLISSFGKRQHLFGSASSLWSIIGSRGGCVCWCVDVI